MYFQLVLVLGEKEVIAGGGDTRLPRCKFPDLVNNAGISLKYVSDVLSFLLNTGGC
jgi:hypothetical protein